MRLLRMRIRVIDMVKFIHNKLTFLFLVILNLFFILGCQEDEALTKQGYKAYREGNYNKAIQYFDAALSANPYSIQSYLGRGNSWAEKKKYTKALKDYDQAIEIDPSFAQGYYARGYLWAEMGNISNAISDYTETIRLNPRYVSAYINRGNLLKKQGQATLALKDYTAVLALTPNDPGALRSRGYLLVTLERFDEAIIDYSRAIDIDPKHPHAFSWRAEAWYETENYEKAIHDCEKAIELQSVDSAPYNNLAWILATCPDAKYRDGERAVIMAKKALQMVQNSSTKDHLPDVYNTLAAAYAESHLFELAIQYQTKAILQAKAFHQVNVSGYEAHLKVYKEGKPLRLHGH